MTDGQRTWVQTTRNRAEELELVDGQIVYVRPERSTVTA
jgi:hypothetical protein